MLIQIQSKYQFDFIRDFLRTKKYKFYNPSENLTQFARRLMLYEDKAIFIDTGRKEMDYWYWDCEKDFERFKKHIHIF